jgi:hypothetical protein
MCSHKCSGNASKFVPAGVVDAVDAVDAVAAIRCL